jgi:pyruvate formate lyase activating enzyme
MASVIFLTGCNFRCPYCQNPDLVLDKPELLTIPEEKVLGFLKEKRKWLDGVCISGGEPTAQRDLPEFVEKIKNIGLKIKIDTNGSNPEVLKELIDKGLVDYIAMDIKAPIERYGVVKGKINIDDIKKSVDIIKGSDVDYEFRITAVPKITKEEDIKEIGKWLKDSKRFFIQQFRPMICLDKEFENIKPYTKEELERLIKTAEPYFECVGLRGV